jgi:hypothetical protein
MREIRSSGSVRGASGDGRPYRERNLVLAAVPAKVPSASDCGPSVIVRRRRRRRTCIDAPSRHLFSVNC